MHSALYGITLSGKSHLAKTMAATAGKRGVKCVALDPLESPDWPENTRVCSDWNQDFMEALQELSESGGGYVFIDEADIYLSQSNKINWWIVTRGRHYGFRVFVLSQRPALVAPTVRTQCETVYMYRLSENDAKMIADECADKDIIVRVPALKRGWMARAKWGANGDRELNVYKMWTPTDEKEENSLDAPIESE